jgi:hypothetical protein
VRLRIVVPLLLVLCAAPLAATAAAPTTSVSTASFSVDGIDFTFAGTFRLDHFDVATPASFPEVISPTGPRLAAAGTVSGVLSRFGHPDVAITDAPFTWVNVSIAGSCDAIEVTLESLGWSDYLGLHGEVFYPGLPLAPWGPNARWATGGGALEITGTSRLLCAAAQVSGAQAPPQAVATVLNRLLATAA